MKDYKIWLGGLMYFGLIVPAYSYAFFSPAIIQTYNYDAIQTQLHSVPPWVAAFGGGVRSPRSLPSIVLSPFRVTPFPASSRRIARPPRYCDTLPSNPSTWRFADIESRRR